MNRSNSRKALDCATPLALSVGLDASKSARGLAQSKTLSRGSRPQQLNATDFLAHIRVASPCSARWADMSGDDRTRYCAHCRKHVYNLSEMSAEAAANLIREKEGDLCARFHRRKDGTVLTADCPVGAARVSRRFKRILLAAVPVLVAAAVVNDWACGNRDGNSRIQSGPTLAQRLNTAVWKVKGWLGISPPVMGGTCAPPPAPTPPPSPSGNGM